nr:proteinase inhibitor 3 - sea anemone (Stichodactyla sp.) (fragments) [Stichodactyla sp.]
RGIVLEPKVMIDRCIRERTLAACRIHCR